MNWSIETSPLKLPNESVEINLRVPQEGWIAVCDGLEFIESLRIRDGPGAMLELSPMGVAIQYESIVIINTENVTLPLLRDWSGDAPSLDIWSVSAPDILNQNQSTLVTITSEKEEGLHNIFWISTTDEAVVLNLQLGALWEAVADENLCSWNRVDREPDSGGSLFHRT